MTTLKVGLIGVGRLGRMYGQYLARRVPGVALAAVADRKADVAKQFAGELGIAKCYADHQELLSDG
ncbi:MAG TPA: Gfo/Idh/MocA family oxidoreductase, partial [Bryobacteraceae bacterium]|nr:Gfo/Idh/MocA family oxidoreductase [Bryobacteraceae bacterium]